MRAFMRARCSRLPCVSCKLHPMDEALFKDIRDSIFPEDLLRAAAGVLDAARKRDWKIATAESCTGGLIAAILTEIPGCSDVFERGFVTYSNESKQALLGVHTDALVENGAVSEAVAAQMARGARENARADIALSVTGIAGPGGGGEGKPVGTVWFGLATKKDVRTEHHCFTGDRAAVRLETARKGLALLSGDR